MLQIAKYKGFGLLLIVAMASLLAGCKKELVKEPGDATVNFIIDWSNIKSGITPPSDAVIYLYSKNGGSPVVGRASTVTKAEFKVKAGMYQIIMYNDGLQAIRLANSQSYKDFLGYLEPTPIAKGIWAKGGEELIVPKSDYLHLLTGASSKEVEVLENVHLDLTLRPRTASNTLRFTVEIKAGGDYEAVSARMSGIATRMELFSARILGEGISSVVVPMSYMPGAVKKLLVGQTEILGIDPVNRNPGSNVLELVLRPVNVGGDALPDIILRQDVTDKLIDYENMNLLVEIVVTPDPYAPEELILDVEIHPWEVDPPLDFDVVPTE